MNDERQREQEDPLRKATPQRKRTWKLPDRVRKELDEILDRRYPQPSKQSMPEQISKQWKRVLELVRLHKWKVAPVAGFAAILLACCVACWLFFYVPNAVAMGLGREVAATINAICNFTPQVTYKEKVVVAEKKEISELATAQRTISVIVRAEDSWFFSRKIIAVRGVFTVKAGFNLQNKSCNVAIGEHPLKVLVRFPKPTILSATPRSIEFLKEENGLWNKIKPEDREQVIRKLTPAAFHSARTESPILKEAQENVKKQLEAKAAANHWNLEVNFQ